MLLNNENRFERIKELVENLDNRDELIDTIISKVLTNQSAIYYIGYNVLEDKIDVTSNTDNTIGYLYAGSELKNLDFINSNGLSDIKEIINNSINDALNLDNLTILISEANNIIVTDHKDATFNIRMLEICKISSLDIDLVKLLKDFDVRKKLRKESRYIASNKTTVTINEFESMSNYVDFYKLETICVDFKYRDLLFFLTNNSNCINILNNNKFLTNILISKEFEELVTLNKNNLMNFKSMYKLVDSSDHYYNDKLLKIEENLRFMDLIKFN